MKAGSHSQSGTAVGTADKNGDYVDTLPSLLPSFAAGLRGCVHGVATLRLESASLKCLLRLGFQ
jgi:hypothetical protein